MCFKITRVCILKLHVCVVCRKKIRTATKIYFSPVYLYSRLYTVSYSHRLNIFVRLIYTFMSPTPTINDINTYMCTYFD
uniref:Iap n=1 Tax=Nesodiprion zhejiangensis nucleopolyhedrovirus TaxID=3135970 RepID=A0AAN0LI55_9BACU